MTIGGETVQVPRNKLGYGADGTYTETSTTNPYPVQVRNSSGTELATSTNPLRTDPTGTTIQPVSGTVTANAGTGTFAVSAASLPLPTGAATSANQSTANSALAAIQAATEAIDDLVLAEDTGHASGHKGLQVLVVRNDTRGTLAGTDLDYAPLQVSASGDLRVDGSAVVQPISAASLPLPSGAATSANQATANTALAAIQTAVELIDNTVSGSELQVDVVTLPNVTVGTMANLTESLVDDAAFVPGTSRVVPVGFEFDDTLPDSVDEGGIGAARMSANRNVYTTIRDAAGNERGVNVTAGNALTVDGSAAIQPVSAASLPLPTGAATSANQSTANTALAAIQTAVETLDNAISGTEMQVDVVASLPAGTNAIGKLAANSGVDIGDVDVTSLIPGTSATSLGKAEDAAHASADTGVMLLAVRKATPANVSDTDGDYEPLQVSAGRLWASATIDAAIPAGTNAIGKLAANSGVDIGDVDVTSIAAGDNNIGNVDIVTVPADPFGANADAAATAGSTGTMQAKLRLMTSQLDSIKTATETIDNAISGSEMQVDVVASLPAGTNAIGKLAANSGVDIGDVDVTSIAAGTNLIGMVGLSASASATGTTPHFDSDGDNTAQTVKASAGVLHKIRGFNINASDAWLQLYDESGAITVGTTTPKHSILIPKGDGVNYGTGGEEWTTPLAFANSIKYACTTTPTGSGDPTTGLIVNASYK